MKKAILNLAFAILFFILCVLSIQIGVKDFSLLGFLKNNSGDVYISLISRIPRLVSIIIAGAGLSISGFIMQTITNNKFLSPTTAGTNEWCRFGVMLSILFLNQSSPIIKILTAFVVALFGNFLFMTILKKIQFKSSLMLPLIGIMLGNIVSSITTFFAYKYNIIQNISSWLQGNFSLIIKGNYEILYIGIPCVIIAYIYANKLTIAGMGESFALNLGLNYKKVVTLGLVIISFLTALIVTTIGSIPFVGLIIPNVVTIFFGDSLKKNLFKTAVFGATFVLICDIIGRIVIFPYEISVSTIVGVLGSIVFLFILSKKHK